MKPTVLWYRIGIFFLACSALGLSVFPLENGDIFMDLAVGKTIVEAKGFPTEDPFIFSIPHHHWHIVDEWATHVLAFFLYQLGGWNALVMAKAFLVLCASILPILVAKRFGFRSPTLLIITALATYAASIRFIERASLVTDLFIPLTLALTVLGLRKKSRLIYFLPFIFLLWVNFHPGFYVGLFIISVGALFFLPSKKDSYSKKYFLCVAASYLTCLLNPDGLRGVLFPLQVLLTPTGKAHRAVIYEWFSPFNDIFVQSASVLGFFVLTVLVLALLIMNRKTRPLFEGIIFLGLLYFGLTAIRSIAFVSFCLSILAVPLLKNLENEESVSHFSSYTRTAALFLATWALTIIFWGHKDPLFGKRHFGLGLNESTLPEKGASFIDALGVRTNIFNQHDFGAYLMWRWYGQRKVFYHGDFSPIYESDYLGVNESSQRFEIIVEEHKIGAFFLSYFPRNQTPSPLIYTLLYSDPRWQLVFDDGRTLIFLKKISENQEALTKASYLRP